MKKKIKILRILNRFNLGGPVYNASYLTKYLEDDFDTLLIGGQKLDDEESALYIPESLGISPLIIPEMTRSIGLKSEFRAYQKIAGIIRDFKPDIVHTHASKAGAIGRLAASRAGVKHIVHTYHGHVFEHYFGSLKTKAIVSVERYLAKKSEAIIAISPKQKYDLVQKFNIAIESKVHVIPLGFDLSNFEDTDGSKRAAFRNRYHLKENDIAIALIGRLAPIKNQRLFIEAIAKLREKHKNVRAFIVGDGDLRKELEDLAQNLGLSHGSKDSDVVFTSWIKKVHEVMSAFDVVALTSFNEGTPVSLIEAQAAGIPVVSSDVGGVRDVVHPESGLLFPIGDKDEFIKNLEYLIEHPEKRKEMGLQGRQWALDHFSALRLANDVKKLYLELLNGA